jgi:hypothetical protein
MYGDDERRAGAADRDGIALNQAAALSNVPALM